LSISDIRDRGPIVVTTDGVTVTLPTPRRDFVNYEVSVFNYSTGYISVECIGQFTASANSITLAPLENFTVLCVRVDGATTYRWLPCDSSKVEDGWKEWSPTVVYTTGTPIGLTKSLRYVLYKGICFYDVSIESTDGKACSQIAVPLPPETGYPYIAGLGQVAAMSSIQLVDTTYSNPSAYVDAGNATIASRVLTFHNLTACTTGKVMSVRATGWFEYDGSFSAWTPAIVVGAGSDWATPVRVSRYKQIDNLVFCYHYGTEAAQNNGAGTFSFTPPLAPVDADIKVPFTSQRLDDTTWVTETSCFIDMNDATVTNRLIKYEAQTAGTTGKAAALLFAGVYPHDNTKAYTPSLTITGGPVVPAARTAFYRVIANGRVCWFSSYWTAANSLGTTAITSAPPLAPKYKLNKTPVLSQILSNTTYTLSRSYLTADTLVPASRIINNYSFPTLTTGQATGMRQTGLYEV
jgi:hypothetical protein